MKRKLPEGKHGKHTQHYRKPHISKTLHALAAKSKLWASNTRTKDLLLPVVD